MIIRILDPILTFFSNYFEELILLNVFCLVFALILVAFSNIQTLNKSFAMRVIHRFMVVSLLVGEALLFILTGYVYWLNYKIKPIIPLEDRIVYRTDWVKDKLEVFFISGKNLYSIYTDGTNSKTLLTAEQDIREYHFSPSGRYVVVVTDNHIHLVDRNSNEVRDIEMIPTDVEGEYVLRAVSWAPDNQRFAYEKSFWSSFASQNQFFVYDLTKAEKVRINTGARKIPFLFWDRKSDDLYFFQQQATDISQSKYPFWIKLFKIPLATLEPVLLAQRPSKKFDLEIAYFTSLGADIFYEGLALAHDRIEDDSFWISPEGAALGIDSEDHLYYIKGEWWRKRLFKIPRDPLPGDIPRHQYKGGPFAIRHVRWLPGSRYVLMDHKILGILILEPSTGRIGQLTYTPGHTFGWYKRPSPQVNIDSAIARLNSKPVRRQDDILKSIENLQKRLSGHH